MILNYKLENNFNESYWLVTDQHLLLKCFMKYCFNYHQNSLAAIIKYKTTYFEERKEFQSYTKEFGILFFVTVMPIVANL